MGLLLLFAVVSICLIVISRQLSSRQRELIQKHGCKPAPKVAQIDPVLGLDVIYTQLKKLRQRKLLEHSVEQHQRYGSTYSAQYLGKQVFLTIDPENVKAILATNFKDYSLGYRMKAFGPLLGRGIFTSDGEDWAHSRCLLRPTFIKAQVADLDWYDNLVQQMMSLMPRDGSIVDLSPLFYRLQLDAATTMLFGKCSETLNPANVGKAQGFAHDFDYSQNQLDIRLRMSSLSPFYRNAEFDRSCKSIHEYVDNLVRESLCLNEKDPEKGHEEVEGEDGISRYVFLKELAQQTNDPERLRFELLHVLLAGRDTTTSLLSSTFFLLARRPSVFAKLQAEIHEHLGDEKPSYESMKEMKYLRAVMNEVLRLYPSVPMNMRLAVKDTVLPHGGGADGLRPVLVQKGTIVRYSLYALHRRKDVFGPDADEFRPERWEEGLRPGWSYIPFNGGPRICLGQQLALTQAMYVVSRMLQQFSDVKAAGAPVWEERMHLTLSNHDGVKVRLAPQVLSNVF